MRNPLLVPDLRELIQAGEAAALRDFFDDHHPAHIAEMIEDLEPEDGDTIFRMLLPRDRAEVLSYLDTEQPGPDRRGDAPGRGGRAAAPDVARRARRPGQPARRGARRRILPHLAQAEREDIRRLASYEPGTAGAVMTTDYVTLPPHITVREALERLRHEAPDRETIYYCYVVDHNAG